MKHWNLHKTMFLFMLIVICICSANFDANASAESASGYLVDDIAAWWMGDWDDYAEYIETNDAYFTRISGEVYTMDNTPIGIMLYSFLEWNDYDYDTDALYDLIDVAFDGTSYSSDYTITQFESEIYAWSSDGYEITISDEYYRIGLMDDYGNYEVLCVRCYMETDGGETIEGRVESYSYDDSYADTGDIQYSDWSEWSANPVDSSSTREVETKTCYGYYYYECPSCGNHMHVYDCGDPSWCGGCGYTGSLKDYAHTFWTDVYYDYDNPEESLYDWNGTGRYYYDDGAYGRLFAWIHYGNPYPYGQTFYRYRDIIN